jgi:transcriptional regulator with XRE-family HTH domain
MNSISRYEQIWKSLQDDDFRKQFVDENVSVGLAFQIRALRDRQKLKQEDLAKKLGSKQSLVSSWENPNYGKYTLGTLKDMAEAFDVALLVKFVPFSTLVDWTVNMTSDSQAPPSFLEEERYHSAVSSYSADNNPKKDENLNTTSSYFKVDEYNKPQQITA